MTSLLSLSVAAPTALTTLLASSSVESDGGQWLPLLFLLAGPLFYLAMYLRYRNVHQRHRHESETRSSLHDVQAQDHFIRSLRGVSNSKMQGANNRQVRGRRQSLL